MKEDLVEFIRLVLEQASSKDVRSPLTNMERERLEKWSNDAFVVAPEDGFWFIWEDGNLEIGNRWAYVPENLEDRETGERLPGILKPDGYVDLKNPGIYFSKGRRGGENKGAMWFAGMQTNDYQRTRSILQALIRQFPQLSQAPVYTKTQGGGAGPNKGQNERLGTASELAVELRDKASKLYKPGEMLTMYHGTSTARLPEIMRKGLVPHSMTPAGKQWGSSGDMYDNKAIYLTTHASRAEEYAKNATENHLGSFPAIIKVKVPIDNRVMRADDDWLSGDSERDQLDWEKSLRETGQIAYLGRISPRSIEVVRPSLSEIERLVDTTERFNSSVNPELASADDASYYSLMNFLFETTPLPLKAIRGVLGVDSQFSDIRDSTYFRDEKWKTIDAFDWDNHSEEELEALEEAAVDIAGSYDEYMAMYLDDHDWENDEAEEFFDKYYASTDEFEYLYNEAQEMYDEGELSEEGFEAIKDAIGFIRIITRRFIKDVAEAMKNLNS